MAEGADEDSIIKDELTLPIDWENSGRMSLLGNLASSDEVLVEERKMMKKTPSQPFSSMPDLSNSLQPGSRGSVSSGQTATGYGSSEYAASRLRLTPSGGNRPMTLNEFELQLDKLKKENFNLKLRIHYLENRMPKLEGHSGEDLLKMMINLQIELDTLKNELKRKEKILQESNLNVKHLQNLHIHQLDDYKREVEEGRDKDRQELLKCGKQYSNLLSHYDDVSKDLMDLKAENLRLKEQLVDLASNRLQHGLSESDSEVSLLSDKERLILDLKTQVVRLQCELADQKQKYENQMQHLEETFVKRPVSDARVLSVEVGNQNVQDQSANKINNSTVICTHQNRETDFSGTAGLESTGFETCSILPPADFDELAEMQRKLEEKSSNLMMLENTIKAERFQLHQKVDEMDCLKEHLKREMENGVKRDKIIQGLMKTIDNERKSSKLFAPKNNRMEESLGGGDVSSLTDPSLLGITNCFGDLNSDEYQELGYQPADNETLEIESLKDKFRQFENYRDTLYERIKRVADFLLQLADKLGGDAGKTLLELSSDLSKMREEFDASSSAIVEEKSLQDLKEQIEKLSCGVDAATQVNDFTASRTIEELKSKLKSSEEAWEKKFSDFSESNVLNLAEIEQKMHAKLEGKDQSLEELRKLLKTSEKKALEMIESLKLELENAKEIERSLEDDKNHLVQEALKNKGELEALLLKIEQQGEKRSFAIDAEIQVDDHDQRPTSVDFEELVKKNEKLERYAKSVKSKYRQLEAKIRQNVENNNEKLRTNNHVTAAKSKGRRFVVVDEELENMLLSSNEKDHAVGEDLEQIVRQLEKNNEILAERISEHEKIDGDFRSREEAKVKMLTEKVRNYEHRRSQQQPRDKNDRS